MSATVALAQGSISGRVIDALTQQPLASAQVNIPGTGVGTLTNAAGRYLLINVPAGQVTVRVQRIGFTPADGTVQVATGETATLDFDLEQTRIELDGIVATVDAVAARRRETGTDIARIDVAAAVTTGAVSNMSQVLQGRTAGISIGSAGGAVGSASRIRIRGAKSITQGNNPLIVIDGVRADNSTTALRGNSPSAMVSTTSRFDDLRPEDIEDIQVIKGASATALYGSDAAVGVIVVTTKRGQTGTPQLNFRTRYGVKEKPSGFPFNYSNVTEVYGVTSLDDPRIAYMEAERHPLTGEIYIKHNPLENPLTAPMDRGGILSSFAADASGGSSNIRYYTSIDLGHDTGVYDKEYLDKVSWRGNLQINLSEEFDLGFNAGIHSQAREYQLDGNHFYSPGTNSYLGRPVTALDSQGRCMIDILEGIPDTGRNGRCYNEGNLRASHRELLDDFSWNEEIFRPTISLNANYRPTTWFTNRFTIGLDRTDRSFRERVAYNPRLPFGAESEGVNAIDQYVNTLTSIDYAGTVIHRLSTVLESTTTFGAQYFGNLREYLGCRGQYYALPGLGSCHSADQVSGESSTSEQKDFGVFVLQRFGWKDLLFVSGAMRRDDNSGLGEDVGAIWAPSANMSLVVSELPFFNLPHVQDFRVRAAWGRASKAPGPYQADRFFGLSPVTIDGQLLSGATPANPGNPNLGPERSEEIEVGLDVQLLERIGLGFTYYDVTTRDMIVAAPVAPSSGFSQRALTNLGEMKNSGYEISVDADLVQRRNLVWNAVFTHGTSNPIITDLGLPEPIILGQMSGSRSAGSQAFATGFAPGVYVSRVISDATRDPNGNITSVEWASGNLAPGSDLRAVGKPNPDGTQSLTTTLTVYGNWQISALFDRIYGSSLYNVSRAFQNPFSEVPGRGSYGREYVYRQVESTPVQQAMMERQLHAAYIESGDYTKFRELSVRYGVPESIANRFFGASAASVRLAGRNLYTWTPFSYWDPEVDSHGGDDSFYRHNFGNTQPPPRTLLLELSVSM